MPGSTRAPFASPAFQGKSGNGPWGDAIEEIDWSAGRILDKLVELDLDERTLVVWTSDNGAPLAQRPDDLSRGSNLPLRGRGYTTAEGAFRVPALVWWPGTVPADTVCEELATTMDLLPTFVALAGGSPPQDRTIDGHDILPLIVGEPQATSPYDAFYYYDGDQLQAIRSGPWKLFLPLEDFRQHPHFPKGESAAALLFHLINDIGSTTNVAEQYPDVVRRLTEMAEQARAELGDRDRAGAGCRQIGRVDDPQPLSFEFNGRSVTE
jgi:arylsulfatase A-like enzyme